MSVGGVISQSRPASADADSARRPGGPALSVVIASVNGYHYIAQCLRSLDAQRSRECAEVIVAESSGDDTATRIAAEYPGVTVIPVAVSRTIPELRSLGIRRARGDVVVTTEDHCVFEGDWYERILAAHRASPCAAIGGAVENGSRDRLVDWAAYLCEYGKFMLPFAPRLEADLPGPNVSYKRALLEWACGDLLDRGVWENVIHARLRQRCGDLRLDPSIVVHHAKRFGVWEFLAQRYHFGRSFAAGRVENGPALRRLFYVVVSPLLPPLFLWRYTRCVLGKRRFVAAYLKTFPLLMAFAVAWSVGEFLGYAFGDGGSSLRVK